MSVEMGCDMIKKIGEINNLILLIIVVMLMMVFVPSVNTATSSVITVTFDPYGAIDIQVYPDFANFTAVQFNSSNNYPSGDAADDSFTVWNNGSQQCDIYIFANHTTDSGEMALNDAGSPTATQYSLDVTGSEAQQITKSNTSWILNVPGGSWRTFGLNLDLGPGSADLGYQRTQINITGTMD